MHWINPLGLGHFTGKLKKRIRLCMVSLEYWLGIPAIFDFSYIFDFSRIDSKTQNECYQPPICPFVEMLNKITVVNLSAMGDSKC